MHWKGKKIRVVLFGDYDFILKIFGISGAQCLHFTAMLVVQGNQITNSKTTISTALNTKAQLEKPETGSQAVQTTW